MPERVADVEEALLGCVLLRASLIPHLLPLLGETPERFSQRRWGLAWQTVVTLWREGATPDLVSVCDRMRRAGVLEYLGGEGDLAAAYESVSTAGDAPHYARVIRTEWQRRLLQHALADLQAAAQGDDPAQVAAAGIGALATLSQSHRGARPLLDVLQDALQQWTAGPPALLTTGLPALDTLLGGWAPGALVYLAAATSRGKTAFALHCATHAARHHGVGTAIFSLEMTGTELAERFVATASGTSATIVRTQTHTDPLLQARVVRAAGQLGDLPVWVQDASSLTVDQVAAEAHRLHAQHGLGLVVVDYLGLLRKGDARQSRNDWLGEVSQRLKALAKDLGCPVLALSQLSREAVREGRPPELHHLRDSGNLEQDANAVLMLHRPAQDGPEDAPVIRLDVYVRKNRGGPVGQVPVAFRRATGAFAPWEGA